MRTLRVLKTSTLSVVSAITLSIRSGCLPLTDRAPESSLRLLPLNPCSTDALFGLSTPITAIRDRCSSFCTWPTYLPPSYKSFSRCRLRWTTPPSPQYVLMYLFYFFIFLENLFTAFSEKNSILEKRGLSAVLDPEAPETNTNRYVLADITSFFTLLVGIYFPSVTGQYNSIFRNFIISLQSRQNLTHEHQCF